MKRLKKATVTVLATSLLVIMMAQTTWADTFTPITNQSQADAAADPATGDIVINTPVGSDGITAVDPSGDIIIQGDLNLTVTTTVEKPTVIGVNNFADVEPGEGYTVQTGSITIDAKECNATAVLSGSGATIVYGDITVDAGSVTGTGVKSQGGITYVTGNIKSSGYGMEYSGDSLFVCEGQVNGDKAALKLPDECEDDRIVVYSLAAGTEGLVANDANDELLKQAVNYIIKKGGATSAITLNNVRTIQGYDTARATETVKILLSNGYYLKGNITRNADGSYSIIVPREGGVTVEALQYSNNGGGSGSSSSNGEAYTEEQLEELAKILGATLIKKASDLDSLTIKAGTKILITEELLQELTASGNKYKYDLSNSELSLFTVSKTGDVTQTYTFHSVACGKVGDIVKAGKPELVPNNGKTAVNIPVSNSTLKAELAAGESLSCQLGEDTVTIGKNALTDAGNASVRMMKKSDGSREYVFNNIKPVSELMINGTALGGHVPVAMSLESSNKQNIRWSITSF